MSCYFVCLFVSQNDLCHRYLRNCEHPVISSVSGDDDYIRLAKVLTFETNMSFVEVSVEVDDDDLWEIDENFFGNLRLPAGGVGIANVRLPPEGAMATIYNNDGRHKMQSCSYTSPEARHFD